MNASLAISSALVQMHSPVHWKIFPFAQCATRNGSRCECILHNGVIYEQRTLIRRMISGNHPVFPERRDDFSPRKRTRNASEDQMTGFLAANHGDELIIRGSYYCDQATRDESRMRPTVYGMIESIWRE